MSQDKIESRRAFMKKFGKLAGTAAIAAAFMATGSNNAEAKPSEDNPATSCSGCSDGCYLGCTGNCRGECPGGCYLSCTRATGSY